MEDRDLKIMQEIQQHLERAYSLAQSLTINEKDSIEMQSGVNLEVLTSEANQTMLGVLESCNLKPLK
ncbi:hypothetical protein [Peribacillus asahii]|uniref:hypothetical protein n=1 Tax=Peribacillus asahii TaxID=228899 RepID=UPI003829017F